MTEINISVGPRVHVALADMSFTTGRHYCGLGFALSGPRLKIAWKECSKFSLAYHDGSAHSTSLDDVFLRLKSYGLGGSFSLFSSLPRHCGFGSSTALILSTIQGFNCLFDMGWSRQEVQVLSGRGGVSGVGVNSFFDGGVIWDAGHEATADLKLLAEPSSARTNFKPPAVLGRWVFPAEWQIMIFRPNTKPIFGKIERRFFHENLPIPHDETCEVLAAMYHGVIPAFALTNLSLLALSLKKLSYTGFKSREIAAQGEVTRSLLRAFHDCGVAAGMSSLGPVIYVIIESGDTARIKNAKKLAETFGVTYQGTFSGRNSGSESARVT